MRDYGTGSWAGGDPDCDHVKGLARQDGNRRATWGQFGDGEQVEGHEGGKLQFSGTCGKCGATRTDHQLGLEPTPETYVARMVEVFREVRRVLRKDGSCWINLGSSYFSEPAKGGSGPGGKNEARWNYGRASRGSGPSQSPSPERARAYDSDGTAPQGSQDLGSACLGLCDEHLADFLSHRDRTLDTFLHAALDEQLPSMTGRDSERQDALLGLAPDAPAAVLESTILESWLPLRGECSRCDIDASDLSELRSDVDGVPASAHSSACTPDRTQPSPTSADHSEDKEPSGLAWGDYTSTLKPKDLVPIPWMVAMALQADGWYLRSEIIWAKPNPMPESVTDRPTKSHEYLFLLTRSSRYFYDADAIREPAEWARWGDQTNGKHQGSESAASWIKPKTKAELRMGQSWEQRKAAGATSGNSRVGQNSVHGDDPSHALGDPSRGRNARSVWEIATQPYAEAHFATFPEELPRRCIAAGSSERGCCPECGAPWERETQRIDQGWDGAKYGERAVAATGGAKAGGTAKSTLGSGGGKLTGKSETTGWRPTCDHGLEPTACVVLDPFMGSGTVALVARKLGRRSIGIELSPQYAELAARRLAQQSLFASEPEQEPASAPTGQGALLDD